MTHAVIGSLVNVLVLDDAKVDAVRRIRAAWTHEEQLAVVGAAVNALMSFDGKDAYFKSAQSMTLQAISKFCPLGQADAQLVHVSVLLAAFFEQPGRAKFFAARKFEELQQEVQLRGDLIYSLMQQAIMAKDEILQQAMLRYFFKEVPRRYLDAPALYAASRTDLALALDLRSKLDPTRDDKVIWNGRVVLQLLIMASKARDNALLVKLARELVERRRSGAVDMTSPDYRLFDTTAQKQKMEKTTDIVTSVLQGKIGGGASDTDLVEAWCELVAEQRRLEAVPVAADRNEQNKLE